VAAPRVCARACSPYDAGRDGSRSRQVVARDPLFSSSGCLRGVDYRRERRARTTGDSPSNARTEREHRPRARVSRRGWTGSRVTGGERRRRGRGRWRKGPFAKGPEGPDGGSPMGRKRAASAGDATARIRDEWAGDSPHGATFVAVTLHVERILVEEHVDACEAPPRPRTTVVRPDEGARAFPMVDR